MPAEKIQQNLNKLGDKSLKRHHIYDYQDCKACSPDVVFISHLCFLNDQLSIKQHKATHDDQSDVHMSLKTQRKRKDLSNVTVAMSLS